MIFFSHKVVAWPVRLGTPLLRLLTWDIPRHRPFRRKIGRGLEITFKGGVGPGRSTLLFRLTASLSILWYYLLSSAGRVHGLCFLEGFHDLWPETILVTGHSKRKGENSKARLKAELVEGEVHYYFDLPEALASFEMIFFSPAGVWPHFDPINSNRALRYWYFIIESMIYTHGLHQTVLSGEMTIRANCLL